METRANHLWVGTVVLLLLIALAAAIVLGCTIAGSVVGSADVVTEDQTRWKPT